MTPAKDRLLGSHFVTEKKIKESLNISRVAKPIHCAQNVKTMKLCTEYSKRINSIFLICHMGQKLKLVPISLKIVSNYWSCHKDSKNV